MHGSSPLARGTPAQTPGSSARPRFIPARAGNTSGAAGHRITSSVHPRSRGEHRAGGGSPSYPGGSSPLARGTRRRRRPQPNRYRFIPARAGNTCRPSGSEHPAAVHPRSRGEHPSGRDSAVVPAGSSPLARGTHAVEQVQGHARRFIPARAGNTRGLWRPLPRRPVHPRSRGEHEPGGRDFPPANGSSPLARGTPKEPPIEFITRRFIPARAGNTDVTGLLRVPGSVHPRSRGEHERPRGEVGQLNGSSPLARGTPRVRRDRGRA